MAKKGLSIDIHVYSFLIWKLDLINMIIRKEVKINFKN